MGKYIITKETGIESNWNTSSSIGHSVENIENTTQHTCGWNGIKHSVRDIIGWDKRKFLMADYCNFLNNHYQDSDSPDSEYLNFLVKKLDNLTGDEREVQLRLYNAYCSSSL